MRSDVVIIGGGPAGALAALHFARLGWQTLLIERGARNREKACGHCLNPRSFPMLARAGVLERVRQIAAGCTRTLRVHGHGMTLRVLLDECRGEAGLLVARPALDQLLRDAAGAAGAIVLHEAAARLIRKDAGEYEVEALVGGEHRRLRVPLIIGADGVGSGVARAAGLVGRTAGRKFGFSFDYPCDARRSIEEHAIEMFVDHGGYLGAVRCAHGLHLGGLVSHDSLVDRQPLRFVRSLAMKFASLRELGLDAVRADQALGLRAIGPMPWCPGAIATQQVALIGDAAGYIEPFTGEGMTWAMQSAEALAEVVSEASPGTWNARLAQRYTAAWRSSVLRRQVLCRTVAGVLARPRIAHWSLHAGALWPGLARRLARKVMAA